MLWFTSDLHLGHPKICQYTGRPFASTEEMDEHIIHQSNSCVGDNDTLWHLGDFSLRHKSKILEYLRRLNGKKRFIWGNHDKDLKKVLRAQPSLAEWTGDYAEIEHDETKIVLAHYGHRVWNKSHRGSIHLHGHSHGTLPPLGRSVDVGIDAKFIHDEYRPTSIDEIMAWMKDRPICKGDYHGD